MEVLENVDLTHLFSEGEEAQPEAPAVEEGETSAEGEDMPTGDTPEAPEATEGEASAEGEETVGDAPEATEEEGEDE